MAPEAGEEMSQGGNDGMKTSTLKFYSRAVTFCGAFYLIQCGALLWLLFNPVEKRSIPPAGVNVTVYRDVSPLAWVPFVALLILIDRQGYTSTYTWNGLSYEMSYDIFEDIHLSQLTAEADGNTCDIILENRTVLTLRKK